MRWQRGGLPHSLKGNKMELEKMSVKELIENHNGRALLELYAPALLKYPLKLFYKKSVGEAFELIVDRGVLSDADAKAALANIKAVI